MSRLIRVGIICAGLLLAAMTFAPAIRSPRETGAVKAITTIHTAQVQYYSNYNRFATTMQELGPPASGADGPSAAGLIERDLASGEKGGFKFNLQPTATGYAVAAVPLQFGTAGTHTYFSDQSMSIHQHNGQEAATVADPLIGESQKEQAAPASGSAAPAPAPQQ